MAGPTISKPREYTRAAIIVGKKAVCMVYIGDTVAMMWRSLQTGSGKCSFVALEASM
jgi:hypothetical protein